MRQNEGRDKGSSDLYERRSTETARYRRAITADTRLFTSVRRRERAEDESEIGANECEVRLSLG